MFDCLVRINLMSPVLDLTRDLLPTECCKLKRPHFARVYLMSSVLDLAMDLLPGVGNYIS